MYKNNFKFPHCAQCSSYSKCPESANDERRCKNSLYAIYVYEYKGDNEYERGVFLGGYKLYAPAQRAFTMITKRSSWKVGDQLKLLGPGGRTEDTYTVTEPQSAPDKQSVDSSTAEDEKVWETPPMKAWLARDFDGVLYLYYGRKPKKNLKTGRWSNGSSLCKGVPSYTGEDVYSHTDVQWTDYEPTEVQLKIVR